MALDLFNIDEILAIAEKIERDGATFYRTVARGVVDDATREMLEELARMEEDHEQTLAGLRADLSEAEKGSGACAPYSECARYLNALATKKVFNKKQIDMNSLGKVLKEAIATEKESIAFYAGIEELVGADMGKDKIKTIIKEEMAHIVLLADKLSNLN